MNEHFEDMKNHYLEETKKSLLDNGFVVPSFAIMALKVSDEQPALIHMPLPSIYLDSEKAKDRFFSEIFPKMAKEIRKDFKPFAILWASEAYYREAKPDFDLTKDNYQDLPIKKEVLIITVDSEEVSTCEIYEIIKSGMSINEEGLIDQISLEKLSDNQGLKEAQGRFSNLYKKLMGEV